MYDVAIVGGGIVGLATGRELLIRRPGLRLLLLEKEAELASHQSVRNSGVIHSGIYYRPGSLRATLCRSGSAMLRSYCAERGIETRTTGKLIVATDERELPLLEELRQRGIANGVPDLQVLDDAGIREREPHCAAIRAILVPETAIVDFGSVAASFAKEMKAGGAEIVTEAAVLDSRPDGESTVLETATGEFAASRVVACAGLGADAVARALGGASFPHIEPVRGEYLALKAQRRDLVNGCIYPVPNPRFPFLGAHATPRIDGRVSLGPGDAGQSDILSAVQRFLPDVRAEDTEEGGFGIRAQGVDEHDRYVDDFVFEQNGNAIQVRNAPSPAATACMAIARHIADLANIT